VFIFPVFMF